MFQVKPNIGILNALVRITFGLTLLSWVTAKLVKQPWRESYLIVAILAAMKVGEGIVRYCPVTELIKNGIQAGSAQDEEEDYVI
ncbi:hypothetical protein SAMN05877753_104456 [Bacillus oleivorans]|uniref:Inner membrane protein YgaP-like transmembrane domain-containing protein n=1 Tax=Bacillus oleivorans TaxID=1448271 RepID=A0A285CVB4_9BACI|nr:DUF2892 domain-containing protein [Bacillus oleivorans]SNX70966.1 hypothetical protein SAMN05877753_104456 [Bacillus oleivorans]